MKTMGISEFKAHALKVIDEVAKSQETMVITKRGRLLVQVVPHPESETKPTPGKPADAFVFEKDINMFKLSGKFELNTNGGHRPFHICKHAYAMNTC